LDPWKIRGFPDDGVSGAGLHLQLREGIKGCNLVNGGVVIHWKAGITMGITSIDIARRH